MVLGDKQHDRRSFLQIAGSAGAAGMGGLAGCTGGDGGDGDGGDGSDGGNGDGGGGTPEPTPTREKTEERSTLRIGYLTWRSGPLSGQGEAHKNGAEIVLDRVNEAGGANGHEFEWFVRDTESSPETAVQRARQLIQQEDVDLITGCHTSASGKALNQFTSSQDIPLIFGATQTPDVTKQECAATTFRPCTNLIHQEVQLAEAVDLMTPSDATRVAGINPDYVYGHQSWEVFKRAFKERRPDVEYVSEQFPAFLKGDYKKEIQAILDTDPDVVQSVLFSGDMIAFIKQAHQFNFFDEIDHFATGALDPVSEALEDQMVEAIAYNPTHWSYEGTDKVRAWAEEYVSRYNAVPDGWFAAYGQMNMECLRAAVEAAGSVAQDDLVDALKGLTFSSAVPDTTIREGDHQGFHELNLVGRYGPTDKQIVPGKNIYGFTDITEVPAEVVRADDPDECEAF